MCITKLKGHMRYLLYRRQPPPLEEALYIIYVYIQISTGSTSEEDESEEEDDGDEEDESGDEVWIKKKDGHWERKK